MKTYTGYGIPVSMTEGAIADARFNMHARNFNDRSMEAFTDALSARSFKFNSPVLSGKAKHHVKVIPNSDGVTGILLVEGPMRIPAAATNTGYFGVDEKVNVVVHSTNFAPYSTVFSVQQPDGSSAVVSQAGWVNMLVQYQHVKDKRVDEFAQRFGFKDAEALIECMHCPIPDEVAFFAAWLGIFKNMDDVLSLKPMSITVQHQGSSFVAMA